MNLVLKPAQKPSPHSEVPAAAEQPRKSVSRQMQERFERRRLWRHGVAVTYVAVMATYLAWRLTIINPHSLGLSIAYFTADFIGFILGVSTIIASWNYRHREPLPAPVGLSVDVFVPTYREPLHIIRRTVMAAKAIGYPHGTIILDDGKRDEVKALAEELGLRYLRRPENLHAKAGNLNYGLAHSRADFVMVFDADHIAMPHALDLMLGFFSDEKVAMVQTPQDYYNTDAFQYMNAKRSGALWHDQSFFYSLVQSSADAVNAASCVGTGVVYRRAALDRIGGIPVDTVTEDMHTSLKLHKAGYQTVYLNEPIAYGVAAADLAEYYKTRHRWAHGNLHAAAHENLLFCKGLTPAQRFHYFALNICYFEGVQQLLLFAIPVISLLFGLQPFTITIFNVLVVMLFPFISYLLLQEIGCGFSRYWANEMFSMARWPVHILAMAGLFKRKMMFRSSAKNVEGKLNWRLMAPQLTVVAASLIATGIGIYQLHGDFTAGPLFRFFYNLIVNLSVAHADLTSPLPNGYTMDLVAIAGFWALYGVARALLFMMKARKDARRSHSFFRFNLPLPVILEGRDGGYGRTLSISEEGMRFCDLRAGLHVVPKSPVALTLVTPAGQTRVRLAVERVEGREIEGRFLFDTVEQRDWLANSLYSVDWHHEFRHRTAYFLTPSDVLSGWLAGKSTIRQKHSEWDAMLYRRSRRENPTNKFFGVIAQFATHSRHASCIAFQPLEIGETIYITSFSEKQIGQYEAIVEGLEPVASLGRKGLDGASINRYRLRLVAGM